MHKVVTFVFVWLAVNLAGAIGYLISWHDRVIATAIFVALIAAYSIWTTAGRKSDGGVFMLAGVALLPVTFAIDAIDPAENFQILEWLFLGWYVGLGLAGMDSGLIYGLFLWWLSVVVLIWLALMPRLLRNLGALRATRYP